MTLLQQSIQQQEATHSQKTSQLSEQLHSLEDKLRSDRFKREINEGNVLNDIAKVEAVVDGVINSRGLGQVDQLSVDIALSKNNEYILQVLYVCPMYAYLCMYVCTVRLSNYCNPYQQLRTMGETLRFEIVSDSKEEFNSWRRKVEEKIENVRQASTDNRYCRHHCLHCIVTSANIFFSYYQCRS